MRARFENWVNGLNGDWCISRQRFFGVPFPVWYRLREDGTIDHQARLVPDESRLPIDPSTDVPDGFTAADRGRPGGFVGDPDVMDTWATSSISPQLVTGWSRDADLFARTFPMDLRPQAHDIIRTWLFSSVLRAHLENDSLPWRHAAISGWVLDPDRKKMSKSKGNVVTPLGLLQEYGSDGVRYWAARGGPGVDTAFDVGQMKIGRRLAIKLLNASKFVLGRDAVVGPVTHPLDRALLTALAALVAEATSALEAYEYTARPRSHRELLLVVLRRLSGAGEVAALRRSRRRGRRLGQRRDAGDAVDAAAAAGAVSAVRHRRGVVVVAHRIDPSGRVARRRGPRAAGGGDGAAAAGVLETAVEVLTAIRRTKSEAKVGMKAVIERAEVRDTAARLDGAGAGAGRRASRRQHPGARAHAGRGLRGVGRLCGAGGRRRRGVTALGRAVAGPGARPRRPRLDRGHRARRRHLRGHRRADGPRRAA